MTRMLVSVRSVDEALQAAAGGADFIDLKEPRAGALGGLPTATIAAVVAALRDAGCQLPVSATIGDWPMHALAPILDQVRAVAACGVDYVKVGIERGSGAAPLLQALAASGTAVVPVFIADQGLDMNDVALACSLGFPGLMVDTADKHAGSLFDCAAMPVLRQFLQQVRASGAMAGLAGALRLPHVPLLRELAPDFAGFRSAVCDGDRGAALDPRRLRALAEMLRADGVAAESVQLAG
jgi:(5-formylfuran-3-yl)methyl phosphate synthase